MRGSRRAEAKRYARPAVDPVRRRPRFIMMRRSIAEPAGTVHSNSDKTSARRLGLFCCVLGVRWAGAWGGAMLLAALLAGCADNRLLTGSQSQTDYAMATPGPMMAQAGCLVPYERVAARPEQGRAASHVSGPARLRQRRRQQRTVFRRAAGRVAANADAARPAGALAQRRQARQVRGDAHRRGGRRVRASARRHPPVGKFGVQIAARRSEAEARGGDDEMRAKFPSLLGHQWATINRVSLPQGVFYRVTVGPLGSAQQAAVVQQPEGAGRRVLHPRDVRRLRRLASSALAALRSRASRAARRWRLARNSAARRLRRLRQREHLQFERPMTFLR